tara:strand:+ start:63 stop:617 length:555 start_codon:yes stop_codon:yes gene_type:complete
MDKIIAFFCLLALSPIMVLAGTLLYLLYGSPIFFSQERVGKNLKKFKIYKFRSMKIINDNNGNSLPDEYRLNNFYILFRRFKLDELPQLFNIFIGQMSFIGPRPWPIQNTENFCDHDFRRFEVKPGLSGLAQVNGNIDLSIKERLHFDLKYVNNLSFILDLKIFIKTFLVVLFGEKWGKKNLRL